MRQIILRSDNESEVDIFESFLNSQEFPQHRNIIFSRFPELMSKLDSRTVDERSVVRNFLDEIKRKNDHKIQKAIAFIKVEIEMSGERTLEILSKLMNCEDKNYCENYFIIPTIFPLSPFRGNTFFYSINRALDGVVEYPDVLAVSAHEVSHILLFHILEDIGIQLSRDLLYFIKELIAPVLVYQDDFSGVFRKKIIGNYNVLEIYFGYDDKILRAFDFFFNEFSQNRSGGKNFNSFLRKMVSICMAIEPEIKEKRAFDNRYGIQIMNNPELLKQFRQPIKIERIVPA